MSGRAREAVASSGSEKVAPGEGRRAAFARDPLGPAAFSKNLSWPCPVKLSYLDIDGRNSKSHDSIPPPPQPKRIRHVSQETKQGLLPSQQPTSGRGAVPPGPP